MKKIILLLFPLLFSGASFSQDLTERYSEILGQLGKEIPSDQLFLHLDRNLYHAGDTIRFQAYIRDSRTGVFTTESSSLYALLINSDHATADSARFRISYSSVSGWLKVPDDATAGDYKILAFTSIDMNYSPEYAFSAPVKIEKLTAGKSGKGEGNKNETAGVSSIPLSLPQLDLRFLPEGGTFISGIKQRLAFNAVRANGKELEISGKILNQRNEKITGFKSEKYGPGVVEFTPVKGDTYFAVIDGDEFRDVKWSLPFAEKSGIAMRVINTGPGLMDITLKSREVSDKLCFLTVTMNNILVFSEDIRPDTLYKKRIQTDKLPAGTAFVTLYDQELNPIAERLAFINDYKKINVSADISAADVFRGEETELTIHTTDDAGKGISSFVSVAVIDSVSGFYPGIAMPEIESSLLFDREFYNNLPFRTRCEGLQNIDRKNVDILLMTFGWRSFHPKEIAVDSAEKEVNNYDFLKILNPGPPKKVRSDIKLISDANANLITLPINEKQEAELQYDSLAAGAREILILPDETPAKNRAPVSVVFPENKVFTEDAKQLAPFWDYLEPEVSVSGTQTGYDPGSIVVIEPVTIKAPKQQPKKYEDKYAKMYQYAGTRTMTGEDFREAGTFEDILFKYNPFYINTSGTFTGQEKAIYLRGNEQITGTHIVKEGKDAGKVLVDHTMLAALIVVDNNPIGKTYESIASMPATEIVSVTFLRGTQGFAMYGSKANGGVVFVTTKMGAKIDGTYVAEKSERTDDLLKAVRLFRTETEYYIPAKEEVAQLPEFQFRSTILWKSDLLIDESGTIKIKYPNNLAKGTAMVFVNGISFTNLVGSGRYTYKVH